jgi:serine/threonine-protein kinase
MVRPALPDVIDGRYRIVGRLGAGTSGIVLRGEDLFLERLVAIKIVESGDDPQITERFVKEAQALAQVRHENIVQVYAFGRFQTASYLAMELVMGQSLESIIDAHGAAGTVVDLPRAIAILRAIAHGLDAVHAQSLVHRDVKPANVIIEETTDRPVLIDFGLARRHEPSNPRMSVTGGTPSYMAPEQTQDPRGLRVSGRTDLYALACTAFELLTGRPVFEGLDIYTVLLAHLNETPRKISSVRDELAPFDEVIARCLAKDPDERYATADELITALEARMPLVGQPLLGETPARPRVMIAAADTGFRRSLSRNVVQAIRAKGLDVEIDEVASGAEAVALASTGNYALFVIDEDSLGGRTPDIAKLARAGAGELVIVSRDFHATSASLGDQRVRHLVPKPLNVHVLSSVLARTRLVAGTDPPPSSVR